MFLFMRLSGSCSDDSGLQQDQRSLPAVYRGLDSPPSDAQFIKGLRGVDDSVKELLKGVLIGTESSSRESFLDRMRSELYRSQRVRPVAHKSIHPF